MSRPPASMTMTRARYPVMRTVRADRQALRMGDGPSTRAFFRSGRECNVGAAVQEHTRAAAQAAAGTPPLEAPAVDQMLSGPREPQA